MMSCCSATPSIAPLIVAALAETIEADVASRIRR